jgi:single-stranded-DNA-specific exonuclease
MALKVPAIVARLLCQRGLGDPECAARFLDPRLEHLHDPMLLADMRPAVERILAAIARCERIAIHGDYDVDGITSTVILRRRSSCSARTSCTSSRAVDRRLRPPAGGDRAAARAGGGPHHLGRLRHPRRRAALRARELGVDLIVTDHHEPDTTLPPAMAVINPKRSGLRVSGQVPGGRRRRAEVVQALCRATGRESWLPGFVKIAAIGTLADVVPLVGENRVIAKIGLDLLSRGPHKVGLRALLDVSGLTGKTIDSYHISFMVAPRGQRAGRMSTPDLATRLLLASDEALGDEVRELAQQLDGENLRRQEEEAEILAAARKVVRPTRRWGRARCSCRRGRLASRRHRHRRVEARGRLSSSGDRVVGRRRGGARVVPEHSEFDMLGALERCAGLFIRFGGPQAGRGLTMEAARIKELRHAVNEVADETLGPDDLMPRLRIDGDLTFRGITGGIAAGVASLAPFGAGNPRPVFAARGWRSSTVRAN